MSYLPPSTLYERESTSTIKPQPERPMATAPRPTPAVQPPAPVAPVAAPVVAAPPAPPAPAAVPPITSAAPLERGPKEWLVAPEPMFRTESSKSSPASEEASSPPESMPAGTARPRRGKAFFDRAHKVVMRHIGQAKTKPQRLGDPDVLWFAVMSVGSVCMGLMIWGAYSSLPRFGNYPNPLRAETFSPKLMVVSGEYGRGMHEPAPAPRPSHSVPPPLIAPAPAPPIPSGPPLHATIGIPPAPPEPIISVRAPEPPLYPTTRLPDAPAFPVEPPLAALPERKEPAVFVQASLGETPMIRTWKKLADYSLLISALTMTPVHPLMAQVDKAPIPPAPDYTKQIDALTKAVQLLTNQVGDLKIDEKLTAVKTELNDKISRIKLEVPKNDNAIDIQLLANRLDSIEKTLNRLALNPVAPAPAPVAPPVQAVDRSNLDEIKNKLGNIEQAILKLQPSEKRIALAPPTSPEPAAPAPVVAKSAPANAHVIFVNLYNQDLWLWVNQKPHLVPANRTLTLDAIPVGASVIEVKSPDGIHHRATPNLVANETFTLTAR